jgi:hypothetical protein
MNDDVTGVGQLEASGREIMRVFRKIEAACMGEKELYAMAACQMAVFIIQKPSITSEQLSDGVRSASEHVAHFLAGIMDSKDIEKSKLN